MSVGPHTHRETQFTQPSFLPFFPFQTFATYLRCSCCSNHHNTGLTPLLVPSSSSAPALPPLPTKNNGLSCRHAPLLQSQFPSCCLVRQRPNQVGVQSGGGVWESEEKKQNNLWPPLI